MYKSQKVSFCRKFEKFANQLFTCGHLGCMQQYLTHIRIVVPLVPSQSTSTNNSFAIVGQHSPSVTSLWPVHATTLHGIPSMCAHSLHFTLPCVPHHRIIARSLFCRTFALCTCKNRMQTSPCDNPSLRRRCGFDT